VRRVVREEAGIEFLERHPRIRTTQPGADDVNLAFGVQIPGRLLAQLEGGFRQSPGVGQRRFRRNLADDDIDGVLLEPFQPLEPGCRF